MRTEKYGNRGNIIEIYLPFFLVLVQYKIGIISLGTLGLILIELFQIVNNEFKITLQKSNEIFLLLLYVLLRDVLNGFLHISEMTVILHKVVEYLTLFLLVLSLTNVDFSEDRLAKAWKVAGVIYMSGLAYQLICIYVLGKGVAPISIVPGYVLRATETSLRPSSFFAEPASYVCAMLPLEFLLLKRKEFKWAFVTTLMVIVCTSTVGIVLSSVLWAGTLLNKEYRFSQKISVLVLMALGVLVVFKNSLFGSSMLKLSEVLAGNSTVNSRIICGFDTIRTLDPIQWIFGTTHNDFNKYILEHLSEFSPSSPVITYMSIHGTVFINTFCQIILNYGIIGLALYLQFFINRLRKPWFEAKLYILMILISIFAQTKFLNGVFFMELMLILLYDRKGLIE